MNSTDQIIMNQYNSLASSTPIMYNYTRACFRNYNMEMEPRFCTDRRNIIPYLKIKKLLAISCLISSIALLVVFFIYGTLPHLRNLHGKVIMCYALSLCNSFSIHSIAYFHLLTPFLDNQFNKILGMFIIIMRIRSGATFSWKNERIQAKM